MATQSSPPIRAPATPPAERPSLTLTRRFSAAPEKVYAAWADPQKLVQWFGPGAVEEGSVKADIDLRVGGRYRISFNAKGTYNEVGGVYREVVPNQRLVFSWAWHSTPERESLVTISINRKAAARCSPSCTNSSPTRPRATITSADGRNCLAKLESYLA